MLEARDMLNVTMTPAAARVLLALSNAVSDRASAVSAIVTAESGLLLVNDIGKTSVETGIILLLINDIGKTSVETGIILLLINHVGKTSVETGINCF